MAFIPSTYMFLIFLFIVAIAIGGIIANEMHKRETENHRIEILPFVEELLGLLNCKFKHELKEKWHEYSFKFQNGNFIIICREGDANLRIHYPNFFNTTIEYLDIIREICNICNAHEFTHHVLYTTDGKDNAIFLHIMSCVPIINKDSRYADQLRDNLTHFFSIAQEVYLRFDKAKEQTQETTPYDVEKDYLKYEREFFLLRELEISHQPNNTQQRFSNTDALTVAHILKSVFSWEDLEFLELKIITHELRTIVDENEIAKFNISKVLIANDSNKNPVFVRNNATLILTYNSKENNSSPYPQQLVISLQNEGRTPDVLYQRATITSNTKTSRNRNSLMDKSFTAASCISFLFAYDTISQSPKVEEAKRVIQKLKENETSEHKTDSPKEFKFIDRTIHPYLLDICEFGVNLFRQKRYFETIVELEYVYNYLSPFFQQFGQKEQNLFYELCYYIGFSYCELGLYKRAYYYLDAIFPLNNLTYIQTYVNCLVNAKDFRALSVIENISDALENQTKSNNENMPDNIRRFLNFLKRRKAHHYVDLGDYDKAKEIYQVLYLDPENQDYALNELAYLQRISNKEKKKDNSDNH